MSANTREEAEGEGGGDDVRPLRILCIDGGGIKGLIPAVVLEELQKLCGGRPLHTLFDLVCGTSTGPSSHTNSGFRLFQYQVSHLRRCYGIR